MIDWNSPSWGGGVTMASDGSWVPDKHDKHDDKDSYQAEGFRSRGAGKA